jgi:glucose/arabinose dehydrogenase
VRVRFDKAGRPVGGYDDFITGWMLGPDRREVWGRPAGLALDRFGALLIADDAGQRIWRVTSTGAPAQ